MTLIPNETAPVQKPNPPQIPNWLPATEPQFFLHPEHEQLKAKFSKAERHLDHKFLFIAIAALILSGIAASIVFFFLPRTQAFQFAKATHEIVFNSAKNTDHVNKSLKTFYEALNPIEQDAILSSARTIQSSADLNDERASLQKNLEDLFDHSKALLQKGQVKDFSTPSSDPNKTVRDRRDLATQIATNAKDAAKFNQQLTTQLKKPIPQGAKDLKSDLTSLEEETGYYIEQATLTALYYIDLSDASIEMNKLASATLTFSDIDTTIAQLISLKSKFAAKTEEQIPDEIKPFNKDLVEMLDLLINLYKDLKVLENASSQVQLNKINDYKNSLTSIAVKLQSDEISFWKNNQALAGYDDLASHQTTVLKQTKELGNANNYFLLSWMGVRIETSEE